MSISSGFFNSLNGDRKYDANDFSSIFSGIIKDGIFASIGTAFSVLAGGGNGIKVGIGKAWFNGKWIYNDALLPIQLDGADALKSRYDAVVIEINNSSSTRKCDIKVIKGEPSSAPSHPVLENTSDVHQYPLCYIMRPSGSTSISQSNIKNMIGTSSCPYITGILEVQNIDNIVAQWESEWNMWSSDQKAEFDTWFAQIQAELSGSVAGDLLLRIQNIENGNTLAGDSKKLGGKPAEEYKNDIKKLQNTISVENGKNRFKGSADEVGGHAVVIVNDDPGSGASVSYSNGTIIFVKG